MGSTAPGTGWGSSGSRLIVFAGVTLLMVLLVNRALSEIAYPLCLVFGGVVIAQGLSPVATWLAKYLPRPLAVVALYLGFLALLMGTGRLLLPGLTAQGSEFFARMPLIQGALHEPFERWSPVSVEELGAAAGVYLGQISGPLVQFPMAVVSSLANLVLVFFLSLYWLIAQPELRGWVLSLVPDPGRDNARALMSEVGETLGGYVRGVMMSAVLIALLTFGGLQLIGLPSALLLALIAGLAELIPVLGPFIAAAPAVGMALATGEVNVALVVAFYIGLQQVESNILLPLIMRGQARIPPLLSLVAFLIGVAVGGVVGALIAIPLFGALRVIVMHLLVPAQRQLVGISQSEASAVQSEEAARDGEEPQQTHASPPAGRAAVSREG